MMMWMNDKSLTSIFVCFQSLVGWRAHHTLALGWPSKLLTGICDRGILQVCNSGGVTYKIEWYFKTFLYGIHRYRNALSLCLKTIYTIVDAVNYWQSNNNNACWILYKLLFSNMDYIKSLTIYVTKNQTLCNVAQLMVCLHNHDVNLLIRII